VGKIGSDKKVKLFCGIISSSSEIDQKALIKLQEKFGVIELKSEMMPFDYSSYYNEEMGQNLSRYWVSFKDLVFAGDLSDIKIFTNSVEDSFAKDEKRPINIDPGYVSQANVVLATTKNYSHRIYLAKGIYGEVTLIYKKNTGFIKLPWSYPDYLSDIAKNFLLKTRQEFLRQLKGGNK
jgi:hypothetical protein